MAVPTHGEACNVRDLSSDFLELLLPLFQAGRHDAVCDALVAVMQTRDALTLGELMLLGMSARAAVRSELVAFCVQAVAELAKTQTLDDEARAQASAFVRLASAASGASNQSWDVLSLRLSLMRQGLQ